MTSHCLLLVLLLPFLAGSDEILEADPVFLTVSSMYRQPEYGVEFIDRELQLNWDNSVEEVGLFTTDPTVQPNPVFKIKVKDNHYFGTYETNVSLGSPVFPGGWAKDSSEIPRKGDHCLNFWIGAYNNRTLEQAECFKIRPSWMSDNRISIGNLPLTSLLLPGTHNSGCYNRGESLSKRDTLARYVLTQDQDVYSQLVYGIRYIDLRVGVYPVKKNNGTELTYNDNCFWVNHDLIKVQPLVPILKQIKAFLSKATEEIVILDFHRFPVGFTGRHFRHNRLVELLERELKDIAVPFHGYWPSLDDIWLERKQLIIAYGDNEVAKEYEWLWPPVRQQWANQNTINSLKSFLDSCMNDTNLRNPRLGMWAAMAQLTPNQFDILFKPKKSLRTMAHSMNHKLTRWCQEQWWDQANIITSDFFLENNLINIAVAANIEKGNMNKRYDLMM